MVEQLNQELIKIIDKISELETLLYKVDGAIFVKKGEKIINEKVAYMYNLLQVEAGNYGQKQDEYYDEVEKIVNHYRQKLNMIYDEYYCQYVNIQNELQEARINQKIAMINFQKIMTDKENAINSPEYKKYIEDKKLLTYKLNLANSQKEYNEIYQELQNLKSPINEAIDYKKQSQIEKSEVYEKIVLKCKEKFNNCIASLENKINSEFLIESSLSVINDTNIFERLKRKIQNMFHGKENYMKILKKYNSKVDSIDAQEIVTGIKENTIDFVTEILEIESENGLLKEAV
jgi:hypothetical protein